MKFVTYWNRLTQESVVRKAKMTIIVEVEYDLEPDNYPGVSDPMDMLKVDVGGAEADPYMWFDRDNAKWTFQARISDGTDSTPKQ